MRRSCFSLLPISTRLWYFPMASFPYSSRSGRVVFRATADLEADVEIASVHGNACNGIFPCKNVQ